MEVMSSVTEFFFGWRFVYLFEATIQHSESGSGDVDVHWVLHLSCCSILPNHTVPEINLPVTGSYPHDGDTTPSRSE